MMCDPRKAPKAPVSISAGSFRLNSILSLAILMIALAIGACAPRGYRGSGRPHEPFFALDAMGAPGSFRAAATLEFSNDGARRRARADIRWIDDTTYSLTVYDPFGGTIAELWSDSSGAWYLAGQVPFSISRTAPLSFPSVLPSFPFTFDELVRITTGRLPSKPGTSGALSTCGHVPDTVIRGSDEAIRRVELACKSGYRVVYSSFGATMPYQIRMSRTESEYIVLTYDKIIFQ